MTQAKHDTPYDFYVHKKKHHEWPQDLVLMRYHCGAPYGESLFVTTRSTFRQRIVGNCLSFDTDKQEYAIPKILRGMDFTTITTSPEFIRDALERFQSQIFSGPDILSTLEEADIGAGYYNRDCVAKFVTDACGSAVQQNQRLIREEVTISEDTDDFNSICMDDMRYIVDIRSIPPFVMPSRSPPKPFLKEKTRAPFSTFYLPEDEVARLQFAVDLHGNEKVQEVTIGIEEFSGAKNLCIRFELNNDLVGVQPSVALSAMIALLREPIDLSNLYNLCTDDERTKGAVLLSNYELDKIQFSDGIMQIICSNE